MRRSVEWALEFIRHFILQQRPTLATLPDAQRALKPGQALRTTLWVTLALIVFSVAMIGIYRREYPMVILAAASPPATTTPTNVTSRVPLASQATSTSDVATTSNVDPNSEFPWFYVWVSAGILLGLISQLRRMNAPRKSGPFTPLPSAALR